MTRWLTDKEQQAWRSWLRMRQHLDLQTARDLAAQGLSPADYHVLSNLSEADGCRIRMGDLAERITWTPSRLSHQITRMEQRGLVRRDEPDAKDTRGRATYLTLTDKGWATINQAAPGHVESVRRNFIDHFTTEQLEMMIALGDKVAPNCPGDVDKASVDREQTSA